MGLPLETSKRIFGLSRRNAFIKRTFDIAVALVLVFVLWWLILFLIIAARLDTGLSGIYRQKRVGLYGESFTVYKLRSMRNVEGISTTVTTRDDPRITRLGALLRKWKLDELPQLYNVLNGTMSFVGPRPDVPSVYADLDEEALRVLTIRPGITGPASIRYRDEEILLAKADELETYNREVLFPDKVRLNLEYMDSYSPLRDIVLMIRTVSG